MAQVDEGGRALFAAGLDEGGRAWIGRLLEDGSDGFAAAAAPQTLLAAEAALLATLVYSHAAPELGTMAAEIALKGAVFPLGGAGRAEAALLGASDLTAPPPAGRLVRNVRGRPVTWEPP